MKKTTVLMLFMIFQIAVSQNKNNSVISYRYGYNGMEYIATSAKETVIVSTYNSKLDIKDEIAEKIFNYYKENKNTVCGDTDTITIHGTDAKVTGKYVVTRRGKLIAVEFYYEKIEWNSGLTELYKKNLG